MREESRFRVVNFFCSLRYNELTFMLFVYAKTWKVVRYLAIFTCIFV